MNIWVRIAIVALSALSGACAMLAPREDITVYAPALARSGEAETDRSLVPPVQLVVERLHAIAPFDATRIVVIPTPGEVQFYKGVRWQDAAPVMLQELLLQAFRQTKTFASAASSMGAARVDFVLHSDLEAFQAEYRDAATPTVVVRLSVQLQRSADSTIVATRTFTVETASAAPASRAVFLAFQSALDQLFRRIVGWTEESVASAQASDEAVRHADHERR